MRDDFTLEALQHLLGEQDPETRRAFAEHLARDPVAAAAFKGCRDAVALFALDAAPAAPLSEAQKAAGLAALLRSVGSLPAAKPTHQGRWSRWAWPAAAALLVALNLWQFGRVSPARNAETDRPRTTLGPGNVRAPVDPHTGTTVATGAAAAPGEAPDEPANGAPSRPALPSASERLARLEAEYRDLAQSKARLEAEYTSALQQFAVRTLAQPGVARLASMELVDPASYERGDRRGLASLARELLTEPGVISLPPSSAPDPTTPAGGVGTAGTGSTAFVPPSGSATAPGDSRPGQTGAPAGDSAAYAWSVFDESEQRGYLNLYNLPTLPAAESLQVWVRPAGGTAFVSAGQVPPEFHGSSGRVSYQLPPGTAPPAEILVTREPGRTAPSAPTGPTVLRGP